MKNILNVINSILAYDEPQGNTDNPSKRNVDWSRRYQGLTIGNPKSQSYKIPAGQTLTIFDGMRLNPLDGTSILDIINVAPSESRYRLKVTAGASGFKTARSVTGLDEVFVTTNNNSVATFQFVGATLTSVQVGDIMRVNSASLKESSPYVFNDLNGGLWVVIGIAGDSISVMRETGCDFVGIQEHIIAGSGTANDVQFYAQDGVMVGDTMDISGTLSVASQRAYKVLDVTPDQIDFISTNPIPEESGLTYILNTITLYSNANKLLYVEADQDCNVLLNGDTSGHNRVKPVGLPGNADTPGYFHMFGVVFKCEIKNRSLTDLNLFVITGE